MSEPTNDELMQRLEAALEAERAAVQAATERAQAALREQQEKGK